jgi:hypothetical protein
MLGYISYEANNARLDDLHARAAEARRARAAERGGARRRPRMVAPAGRSTRRGARTADAAA